MNIGSSHIVPIFISSIEDWHKLQKPHPNPFEEGTWESLLYQKNHIDTIQWHVEDEIRRPDILDSEVVQFKRQIDRLNQERTDCVEKIDDAILDHTKNYTPSPTARLNSESPAWLIDRMSILELKIYHMQEQVNRKDASSDHISKCQAKLSILLEQRKDLSLCLDELMEEIQKGTKKFKVYRQMKMYNDKNLNPSLYQNTK
jgi:hypothetical protein